MSRNALRSLSLFWIQAAAAVLGCVTLLAVDAPGTPAKGSTLPVPNTETNRARVVIVQDPEATDAFRPRLPHVQSMVERGICGLTGKLTSREAWRSLISTQDVVGIKVYSAPGPNSGTRPAVVEAIVIGLLGSGLPGTNIVVWDRQTVDLRLAGFFELADRYGIRVAGSAQSGYSEKDFYESSLLGNLVWGDSEFGQKGEALGRKSYVSKLVSQEVTKIITVSPMLNNNLAGVAGHLFSLAAGSTDNVVRFESDSERLATAVPEIFAMPSLGDKVVLSVTDALVCQYEGNERALLHYSSVLNELRFSFDPVALDVLSLQELTRQRKLSDSPEAKGRQELYENAALLELGICDPKRIDIQHIR